MIRRALHSGVKAAGRSAHKIASANPSLAGLYVQSYRLLKPFPDGSWKNFVANSLQATTWPKLSLPPARVQFGRGISVSVIPHLQEVDFAAHLWQRIPYEREVVEWLAGRKYGAVLEIGANVGLFTLLFSQLWPAASIFSFEPSATAYLRLLRNLELNDCKNVQTFNCAVAAQAGFLEFFEPTGHLTNGSLLRNFAANFSDDVVCRRVFAVGGDEVVTLIKPGQKLLVKIDVEGYEPVVLKTLEPILAAHRPDVLIEVLEPTVDELNRLELSREFRLFALTREGPVERQAFECLTTRDYALLPR